MLKKLIQLEQKEYYYLNEILYNNLTNLKICQLKRRVKLISTKIKDTTLITKVGKFWKIHNSLLPFFQSTWKKRSYNTSVTIHITKNSYDYDYYKYLAERIYSHQIGEKFMFSVETSKEGKKHLHIGTALSESKARAIIKKIEKEFQQVILFNPHTEIKPIRNLIDYTSYISKEMTPIQLN